MEETPILSFHLLPSAVPSALADSSSLYSKDVVVELRDNDKGLGQL